MKTSKAQQSMRTRQLIKRAALKLFNELGTSAVHTHDIAEEAEISPGNLYYHYKDKREIIRDLFVENELYDGACWEKEVLQRTSSDFSSFIEFYFQSLNQHRYFHREFAQLLQKDARLKAVWKKRFRSLSEVLRLCAKKWVEQGIMKPFGTDREIDLFIDACWIVMNFSATYLETKDRLSSEETKARYFELMHRFLLPYHTSKGQKILHQYYRKSISAH